ncbi:hypothetical protein AYO44_15355 [Planctomycetaceae bacterium SCGC AG-212-F19]|nr:hypothetical protein AYO44_15355 [Planctomycetaceae bacterium SCGC AG-212-F19]
MNNLKQIGLAFHIYHDEHGHFPLAAHYSPDGRPLLSWRVLLLPYLEEQPLYQRFHLDEPWDSPHNIKLLEEMPRIYRRPARGRTPADRDGTIYQVFVGPGSIFEGPRGLTLKQISEADGASMTLLVVEAAEVVPWTKPEDLTYAPGQPLPVLGGLFKGEFRPFSGEYRSAVFSALFADGHVQAVPLPKGDDTNLRGMITWNGKESVVLP